MQLTYARQAQSPRVLCDRCKICPCYHMVRGIGDLATVTLGITGSLPAAQIHERRTMEDGKPEASW